MTAPVNAPKVGDKVRYVAEGKNTPDIWNLRKYRDGLVINATPKVVTVYDAEEDDWWVAEVDRVRLVAVATYLPADAYEQAVSQ